MKKLLLLQLFAISLTTALGQKLPKVQTEGLRAPANIKVDGKPAEWGGKLMAYNPAAGFYYSMANDDEFLYILIQAKDQDVINRLLSGGVTFDLGKGKGGSEGEPVGFTYPISLNRGIYFDFRDAKRGVSAKVLDSMITDFNALLQINYKWIRVTGLPELGRTVSIYNDVNLKVAQTLDSKSVYNCELAIALKYLGVPADAGTKFNYHIVVNGSSARFAEPPSRTPVVPRNSDLYSKIAVEYDAYQNQARFRNLALRYPTDFWGEYSLVGK